jgi:hypothetical protein
MADIGKTQQAIDELVIAKAGEAGGSNAILVTAGGIEAAKAVILSQGSAQYRDAVLGSVSNQAQVEVIRKGKELLTKAAIEDATIRTKANATQPTGETIIIPEVDQPDLSTESYLGNIINKGQIYGSIILGDIPSGQSAITWVDGFGITQTLPRIPIAVAVIQCNLAKNIVTTNIQGRDGSVKEYIGMNDASISIDCMVNLSIGNGGRQILEEQLKLLYWCPYAIPITNYYLNALGITNIVIMSMPFTQKPGEYSTIHFAIDAIEDIPITELLP